VAERMEDFFFHDMPLTWQAFHNAGRVAP
jgi:hypothetical protein